ncbi:MAG: NCS2 family permease [Cytophagales bacterium]|nr:NCS2 family permease [Cytophagales bacterium]
MLTQWFKLEQKGTTARREVLGGLTTFLTMAYIIFVNPDVLGAAGMDKGALITVTCLAAFVGTLLVGIWANVPFAMAPGMGLNAFFTYTLVMGEKVSWETALGVVFISGVFFLVLTLAGVREKIINAIPVTLRLAVAAGIGLFIAFIGFRNMGLIVDNPATLVGMGEFTPQVLFALLGVLLIIVMEIRKVKGSILIGILFSFSLGLFFGDLKLPEAVVSLPPAIDPLLFKLDVVGALKISLVSAVFSFMFVDLFDSIGTVMACSFEAGMVDKEGRIHKVGKVLEADAIATIIGSLLGTSTTTTFIESASGIASGARTGLASLVTGALFLLALFFAPLIGAVPSYATAPALVFVGAMMFKNAGKIDYKDLTQAIPAFLTIFLMPLTYSISVAISFGFASYVVLKVLTGGAKELSWMMYFIGVLSVLNLLF